MIKHYTHIQALFNIREYNNKTEINKATNLLYPSAKTYDVFDVHLIGQALKYQYKKLKIEE